MAFTHDLPAQMTDALVSHAKSLGVFEHVNGSEPLAAPSAPGLSAAVWVQSIDTAPRGSGLAMTSGVFTYNVRGYSRMVMQPIDAIDPNLTAAMGLLYAAYVGDFTLGGIAMAVDMFGMGGKTMSSDAGYIMQDDTTLRVITLTVPIIVTDLWSQSP